MNIACVVGARPNFMKMAPLLRAFERHRGVRVTLIHTGQHYDASLSDVFFQELGMRQPDVSLEVGSGKHGEQTARILERMETTLERGAAGGQSFDRLVVVGDVNSTMASALAAAKLGIPVAHVEAGLRSFDRSMPEEINRIVTDSLSDMLFVSEPEGVENLLREGHPDEHIHLIGNVMIDTLRRLVSAANERDTLSDLGLLPRQYAVVTLHRPANVDRRETLAPLVDVLIEVAREIQVVFPIHPRTKSRLIEFGLYDRLAQARGIVDLPPQGYLDFLSITSQARLIVTDSGGLQEESTVLDVPCLTLRPNTERPVTVLQGTSTLVGSDMRLLRSLIADVLDGNYKSGRCPDLWDGRAAERITAILVGQPATAPRETEALATQTS